jgi:AmmeMemoRadiSam system protein A
MLVAVGAAQGSPADCEVLHYEAPFGVGYMVAQLTRGGAAEADIVNVDGAILKREDPTDFDQRVPHQNMSAQNTSAERSRAQVSEEPGGELPALARRAVESYVRGARAPRADDAPGAPLLDQPAACFVSIKTDYGELRGCIGTVEPVCASLAEELIANAVSAATRDPRFPPVSAQELPRLRYSVDVLSEPEQARFEDLDPKNYGVIVEDEAGTRRGLLLPDIEGVDTASQQVEIAARKAAISPREPVRLYRFRVRRFAESSSSNEQTG